MTEEVSNSSKNTKLKAVFILYIVTVAIFLIMMHGSLGEASGAFGLDLGRADFWKGRHIKLLMAGFLLNIIPQAFDLIFHYNALKDNLFQGFAFVATVFLIVFYFMLTNINMSTTSRDDTYQFTKISVLASVFFWFISDVVNLTFYGLGGAFTVIFLINDLLQMAMLVMWGFLMTDYIRLDKSRS